MGESTNNFVTALAEKLIRHLEAGTAPWQKPWSPDESGDLLPFNPTTGKRYRGINALQLMSEDRSDQRWMTYKQAASMDAQVRKGEKGTRIQYWKFMEDQVKTDAAGNAVIDARGEPVRVSVKLERPKVFFAAVFNAEQIDGLGPAPQRGAVTWSTQERAEQILRASGAVIVNGEHDRAFYRPSTDSIHLPDRSLFPTADNYYATALHELGHWTGHDSRLARDLAHPFGSEGYAKEELRAEIASMILGDELRLGHDPLQHAAYIACWIKVLKDDPLEIFRAAADAEKIQEFVLGLALRQVQELMPSQSEVITVSADQPYQARVQIRENDMTIEKEGGLSATALLRAETWMLERVGNRTLVHALDHASLAQIGRMRETLDEMQPLDNLNAFWQRHELPFAVDVLQDRINAAGVLLAMREADMRVAAARTAVADAVAQPSGQGLADAIAAFERDAGKALGFSLPQDWNGRVLVRGDQLALSDGRVANAGPAMPDEAADGSGVYAQRSDGSYQLLISAETDEAARALRERLLVIDAQSTSNEYEKALKLAVLHEERIRLDPDSTDEDIVSAREARKAAAVAATLNDHDLARRIEAASQERVSTNGEPAVEAKMENGAGAERAAGSRLIAVPFKEKDEAKALGAKWDRQAQSWFVPAGVDLAHFSKWAAAAMAAYTEVARDAVAAEAGQHTDRLYLAVPYSDRADARAAGALWDRAAKSWYAGPAADMAKLSRWDPSHSMPEQSPAMMPREEFAAVLQSAGCVLTGEHPIMDGKKHRISVEGEKFTRNSGSGFYVGHLDGHPAGYVKNNKTGAEQTWKYKGYTLDPHQRASMAAEIANKLQERETSIARQHEQAARRVARQLDKLVPADTPTTYMKAKGIVPHGGTFTDKDGDKTYVPAYDADGKLWTMQYIQGSGAKRFAKDSRKEGCFHVVGGFEALAKAPAIVIAEGLATASSLSETLGFATVAAFDAGNLAPVAESLRAKFPNTPFVIAGDDDRHLELTQGVNPGRAKAGEAAELVGGTLMLPIFAPGENAYPDQLDPVTPASFSAHQKTANVLDELQLAALVRMRHFTDFNDLVTQSALGASGLARQVHSLVDSKLLIPVEHQQTLLAAIGREGTLPHSLLSPTKVKRTRAAGTA